VGKGPMRYSYYGIRNDEAVSPLVRFARFFSVVRELANLSLVKRMLSRSEESRM
jgi:hypothetical protein